MKMLKNPISNNFSFGEIDSLNLGGIETDRCSIHLLYGKHIGPNRGFGAEHIFAEHSKEMCAIGLYRFEDVPQYVCNIIQTGTPIYFEGASWSKTRVLAVKTTHGTSILEYKNRRDGAIWSVVTAFSNPRKHGTEVGRII